MNIHVYMKHRCVFIADIEVVGEWFLGDGIVFVGSTTGLSCRFMFVCHSISSSFIIRLRTVVHFGLSNEVTCLFSAAEWLRGDCRELETGIGPGRSYSTDNQVVLIQEPTSNEQFDSMTHRATGPETN